MGDVSPVPGGIVAVPIIVFCLSIWAFLKYSPEHENQYSLQIFNKAVLGLCAVLLVIWYFSSTSYVESVGLYKYIYLFGFGLGSVLGTLYLGVFHLIRNYWIFADTRPWRT